MGWNELDRVTQNWIIKLVEDQTVIKIFWIVLDICLFCICFVFSLTFMWIFKFALSFRIVYPNWWDPITMWSPHSYVRSDYVPISMHSASIYTLMHSRFSLSVYRIQVLVVNGANVAPESAKWSKKQNQIVAKKLNSTKKNVPGLITLKSSVRKSREKQHSTICSALKGSKWKQSGKIKSGIE